MKLFPEALEADLAEALRTLRSAAPLKRDSFTRHREIDLPLRTLRSAAPLKLFFRRSRFSPFILSPHSPECGPVEALLVGFGSEAAGKLSALSGVRPR